MSECPLCGSELVFEPSGYYICVGCKTEYDAEDVEEEEGIL